MKRYTWLMLAMMILPAMTLAEDKPPQRPAAPPVQGERPGVQMLERIRFSLGDLKLTDEQKTKVDAIFKNAREGLDKLREDVQALEPRERMQRLGEFFQSVRDDLAAELNEEQRAILDKKLDSARQNVRNRFRGDRPATAPASPAAGGPARPGEMLERLRSAASKLDLTAEQKQQIKDLVEDVQARGAAMRQAAQAGGEDVRVKGRELMEQTQKKVNAILTPAQQEKLRDLMRAGPAPATQAMMMEGDDMMMAGERKSAAKKTSAAPAQNGDPGKAPVGAPAPPLALKKIDGSLVQLATLKGRVVVLVFGSWTCPAFRDRAAALEKLKNDYSTRAQFFVVYTREAHAKDEWEVARNKDLDIIVEQPKTIEARSALAKRSREELKLSVPIVLDSIGNETATAYGAGVNSAFVINRDGVIVARQQWFDPAGLRRAIDEAAKATPSTRPAS